MRSRYTFFSLSIHALDLYLNSHLAMNLLYLQIQTVGHFLFM